MQVLYFLKVCKLKNIWFNLFCDKKLGVDEQVYKKILYLLKSFVEMIQKINALRNGQKNPKRVHKN